jgi:hypothetical protein
LDNLSKKNMAKQQLVSNYTLYETYDIHLFKWMLIILKLEMMFIIKTLEETYLQLTVIRKLMKYTTYVYISIMTDHSHWSVS